MNMARVRSVWRTGTVYSLFGGNGDLPRGRRQIMTGALLGAVVTYLSAGIFYTGFLSEYGIDIVDIGVITFIPLIANCFGIFSPLILNRFRRRKRVLALSRAAFHTLNILAVTVMPMIVTGARARVAMFALLIFIANLINALFTSGYSAWHINLIPDDVRANYFSFNQIAAAVISAVILPVSGIVTDALSGSGARLKIIVAMRFAAYVIALAEVLFLSLPKEFPYERSDERVRLSEIVLIPVKNRRFMLTMFIVLLWTFNAGLTSSSIYYYLLNDCGVKYTAINLVDASYALFLPALSPLWKRILRRWYWFKTFALTAVVLGPTTFAYACVTSGNAAWIYPSLRMVQHVIGVGINLAYANMAFVNTPARDRTDYISFYSVLVNLSSFLGMSAGTFYISRTRGFVPSLLGIGFSSVQQLLAIQSVGQTLIGLLVLMMLKRVTPEDTTI